jgi:DNA repair exonuclease SbcCD ATPase subunit
LSRAHQA